MDGENSKKAIPGKSHFCAWANLPLARNTGEIEPVGVGLVAVFEEEVPVAVGVGSTDGIIDVAAFELVLEVSIDVDVTGSVCLGVDASGVVLDVVLEIALEDADASDCVKVGVGVITDKVPVR